MNRIILKSGSPIHFSRVVRRTMSFKFPESALWSVSQLGLLGDNENVIGSSELDHLAKLSSVDISVSNVSRDEILNDLNAMLRCAKSLRRVLSIEAVSWHFVQLYFCRVVPQRIPK